MIRLVILPNIENCYNTYEQVNILDLMSEENYDK